MKNPYVALRIIAVIQETSDTKSFILETVTGDRLHYKPGQFITLVFKGKWTEERRSYSISSSEVLGEPLTITVKRIDNGAFSRYLFDECKPGDILYTIGASGFFLLPERIEDHDQLFFLAAGSGITPVFALIKTVLHSFPHITVHLIYSNRSPEKTIFLKEIRQLSLDFPDHFKVEFLFSSQKNLLRARLNKLLLADFVKTWLPRDRNNGIFYLCGPHGFMQMATITLLSEGIKENNIIKEIFDTQKPLMKELPPDQDKHGVTVRMEGEEYYFETQFPDTILHTAKKSGILLPYSCEAGKCGTCAATCVEGRVWMSYNEVLADKEQMKGRVLTCTGYPVGGDVILDFPPMT